MLLRVNSVIEWAISGARAGWSGRVCGGCYGAVKLQERIVWSVIAAGLAVLVLAWWSAHV